MVTVVPADFDYSQIGKNLGKGATEGYMNRSDEMAIQKAVGSLEEGYTPRQLLDAVTGVKTYNPEAKQQFLKNAMGVAELEETVRKNKVTEEANRLQKLKKVADENKKEIAETGSSKALINTSDLPEDEKKALNDQVDAGTLTLPAVKELIKPAKAAPASEFEKGMARENVKTYKKAENDIAVGNRTLSDLNRIDELTEKLSGPAGFFKALNPFNEDASELKSLGYTAIEPIVHIFNPVGPIAQRKLENILKIFGISPLDTSAAIKGKVKALRKYANDTLNLAKKRVELFKEHKGNPPIGALAEIEAEGERLTQDMERGGRKERYYSAKNGKEVVPPDEATLEKWVKEGVITNVKP